mgnify:CR=1 FL=1
MLLEFSVKTLFWNVWLLQEQSSCECLVLTFNSLPLFFTPGSVQRVVLDEGVSHWDSLECVMESLWWGVGPLSARLLLQRDVRQCYRFFTSHNLDKLWKQLLILLHNCDVFMHQFWLVSLVWQLPFHSHFTCYFRSLRTMWEWVPLLLLPILVNWEQLKLVLFACATSNCSKWKGSVTNCDSRGSPC